MSGDGQLVVTPAQFVDSIHGADPTEGAVRHDY